MARLDECLGKYVAKQSQAVKTLKEAYDAFDDMEVSEDGRYTDGWGNSYDKPKKEFSDVIEQGDNSYRYNYTEEQLEKIDKANGGAVRVIEAMPLALGNWLDNPDYWIENFEDKLDMQIKRYSRITESTSNDNAILVKRDGEDGFRIWGSTSKSELDSDFLERISKQNGIKYIAAKVVPNGGDEYRTAYEFSTTHKDESLNEAHTEHDQRTFAIEYCKCKDYKAKLDGYSLTVNGNKVGNVMMLTYPELISAIDVAALASNESLRESDEEPDAWGEEELFNYLKRATDNFTEREGYKRTYYKSEKDIAKNILKKYYKYVDVSDGRRSEKDEMCWVVAYSRPLNK